jgi:hypothetical protein
MRGIGTGSKHIQVVIEFENQAITAQQTLLDMGSDMSCVGQQAQLFAPRPKQELAGLTGVMGHRKGSQFEITQSDPASVTIEPE